MVTLRFKDSDGQWKPLMDPPVTHAEMTTEGGEHTKLLTTGEADLTYLKRSGGIVTGRLRIGSPEADGVLRIHDEGIDWVGLAATGYLENSLTVFNPGTGGLAPIEASGAHHDDQGASPAYARGNRHVHVSGPHGGGNGWGSSGYHDMAYNSWTPMPGGAVATARHYEQGRFRLFGCTYLAMTGASAVTMNMTFLARWSNGHGANWRNSCAIRMSRVYVEAVHNRHYTMAQCEGWVQNDYPGEYLTYVLACYKDQPSATARFGTNYRIGHEWWPSSTVEGGLGSGWVDYS